MSGDGGLAELTDWIRASRRLVSFTGAGISTDSGVPDFRSPGSPWLTNRPIPFDQYMASEAARLEAWRRKFVMDDHYAGAAPALGHRLLARFVSEGLSPAIITQNIDGLHQAAGVSPDRVIELHGNGTYATCLDCGRRHELAWVRQCLARTQASPRCESCSGIVKSATISFGQPMPAEAMQRAKAISESADLFLAIGSSLVVYPAAGLPILAKRNGARLVIINREPTQLDELADLVINAEISVVFARIEKELG